VAGGGEGGRGAEAGGRGGGRVVAMSLCAEAAGAAVLRVSEVRVDRDLTAVKQQFNSDNTCGLPAVR
jgi:hypothetical protein